MPFSFFIETKNDFLNETYFHVYLHLNALIYGFSFSFFPSVCERAGFSHRQIIDTGNKIELSHIIHFLLPAVSIKLCNKTLDAFNDEIEKF